MKNYLVIFLLLVIFFKKCFFVSSIMVGFTECPRKECLAINQTLSHLNETILWPETHMGKKATSQPLCLDENLMILQRHCDGDGIDFNHANWRIEPNCNSIQKPIKNPCPEDLHFILDKYCYVIVKDTSFPPSCPYKETLSWDVYANLSLTSDPIWMPIKRNDGIYGIDLMRYVEPTDQYKESFSICTGSCRHYFYSGSLLDKKCQVYHNSTHIELVRCDSKFSAVCIYETLPNRINTLCSQTYQNCTQSEYSTTSNCFCHVLGQEAKVVYEANYVELLIPYQNLILQQLDMTCRIALENVNGYNNLASLRWVNSKINLTYANWISDVEYEINFENRYGTISAQGWSLSRTNSTDSNCVWYTIPVPDKDANISLDFNTSEGTFEVTVKNNSQFLLKQSNTRLYCFTDADSKSLIYKIAEFSYDFNNIELDTITLRFSPLSISQSGPGYYWCEAFLYPDLNVISTERFLLRHGSGDAYQAEYVAILKVPDYEKILLTSYPLTDDNIGTLQNLFLNDLNEVPGMPFFPRIFKINSIDEIKKEVTITFHLSSTASNNTKEEYNMLENITQNLKCFEYVDFRNVDYCPQGMTMNNNQRVYWPDTNLNNDNNPINGYCVSENGNIVMRKCIGNFIDGAHWKDPMENCTFYASSDYTKELINIQATLDNNLKSQLENLHNLTKYSSEFNTFDIFLVADYLKRIAINNISLDNDQMSNFVDMINNLMKIPTGALENSQIHFKAPDIILNAIDTIIQNGECGNQWTSSKFVVKSINIEKENFRGLIINGSKNSSSNIQVINNISIIYNETFIKNSNVYAAITLSDALYNQIISYSKDNKNYVPKIVISVFWGSQLFIELTGLKFSEIVFGVLLPEFYPDIFAGSLSIHYFVNLKDTGINYNCSYWKFGNVNYSNWESENTNEEGPEAISCEFRHLTNFGLPVEVKQEFNELLCNKSLETRRKNVSYDQKLTEFDIQSTKYSTIPHKESLFKIFRVPMKSLP